MRGTSPRMTVIVAIKSNVMAGLVPATHALAASKDVNARDKPAHDGDSCDCFCLSTARSLQLHARFPHNGLPKAQLVCKHGAKSLWTEHARVEAKFCERSLRAGRAQARVDHGVQLADHAFRRSGRRQQAEPLRGGEALERA